MTAQTPLQRIQKLINLEREDVGTLIIYGVGIGLLSLAMPVAVQSLVNIVAFGALLQPLLVLTLVVLVLVAFSNILIAFQFYVVEMLQRRLFVRIFGDVALRLQQARIAIRDDDYVPEVANHFFDVVILQKTVTGLLLETLAYVLQTVIGMALLAFYHPLLLAFDLFVIAMLALILFVMSKNGVTTAIAQSNAKYAAAAWLANISINPVLGKSASHSAFLNAQTERIAHDYLDASIRHFRILARQNLSALVLHALASTLLLGMGGWMVIERQLSLGQLIAAELVVSAMIYGLLRLGKMLDSYYELLTSVDKMGYLLDLPQESTQGATPATTDRPYQVDIYGAALPESPYLDVLRGLDLSLAPGDKLVISDGANRGSLLDVLFGLRAPSSGYVCLDNHDLRDLNLGMLRDNVSLVRDTEIVEASILDNLCLGRELELLALRQVLVQVGLLDNIAALPAGLSSRLCVNGAPLTAEQSLRLTLARAMVGRPRLLLLDGVLDRIDQRILPTLLDSLLAADAPWTLIVTSHDSQVIARCQRRARIEYGILIETTTEDHGKY